MFEFAEPLRSSYKLIDDVRHPWETNYVVRPFQLRIDRHVFLQLIRYRILGESIAEEIGDEKHVGFFQLSS
jgi:hypothetical protein